MNLIIFSFLLISLYTTCRTCLTMTYIIVLFHLGGLSSVPIDLGLHNIKYNANQ